MTTMHLTGGFARIAAAKAAADRRDMSFNAPRLFDFRLPKSGDSAEVYLIGPRSEPFECMVHTVNLGGKRFVLEACAGPYSDHDGCVWCHQKNAEDPRVSVASNHFFMNLVDSRYVHKEKDARASAAAGRDKFAWNDCSDDRHCKLCARGVPRDRRGHARLHMTPRAAFVMQQLQIDLQKKCGACSKGKIDLLGFKKNGKFLPDLTDVDDYDGWEPQLECSGCDDPTQLSVFDTSVRIRRVGVGQSTTYQMDGMDAGPFPDWVQEIKPADLSAGLQPKSADEMSKMLGIANPLRGGASSAKKAVSYVQDDGDSFSAQEELDEDEEEAPPPPPPVEKKKARVMRF